MVFLDTFYHISTLKYREARIQVTFRTLPFFWIGHYESDVRFFFCDLQNSLRLIKKKS